MSEPKTISIVCKAGFQVPPALLTSTANICNSWFGCVVDNKEKGLTIDIIHKGVSFDQLTKINKAFEKQNILMVFGRNGDGKAFAENAQPFNLQIAGTKKVLAVSLVGDFKKHAATENHTSEWIAAHTRLLPMMQRIYRLCKEDLDAFLTETKTMKTEIAELIGLQGGLITFYPSNGEVFSFMKSMPTFKKDAWGETSDILDYVMGTAVVAESIIPPADDEVVEEEVVEEEVVEEEVVEGASSPITTQKDAVLKRVETDKGTLITSLIEGKEVTLWYPPASMTKNRHLKKAYKAVCGRTITNKECQQRIGVTPKDPDFVKDFKSLGQFLRETGPVAATPKGSDAPSEQKPKATETTEQVVAKDAVTGKDVTVSIAKTEPPADTGSPIYSFVPDKEMEVLKGSLKIVDKNGQVIVPPELYQKMEDSAQDLYKEIGYKNGLNDTLRLWADDGVRFVVAAASPHAMVAWTGDLMQRIEKQSQLIKRLEKAISALSEDPAHKSATA